MISARQLLLRLKPRLNVRFFCKIISSHQTTFNMEAGKRTIESSAGQVKSGKIGGSFAKTANPPFIKHRLDVFEKAYVDQEEAYKSMDHPEITITLPDGKEVKGKAFETTPYDVALGISKGLADAVIGAKITYTNRLKNTLIDNVVDAEEDDHDHAHSSDVFDMKHRLEGDCNLSLMKFDTPEGKSLFWHSSAHLLGQAIENVYGGYLTHGPSLENGFFYDSFIGENHISTDSFGELEKNIDTIISQNQHFQRCFISKEQALDMFQHNPFKVAFINAKIPDGSKLSVYRCGNLIDLCTGPHVPSTGKIKAVKLTNVSSSYWLGNSMNDSLQRVYGVAFPTKKELTEYVKMQEELAKRDHRNIGEQQKLFAFTKYAPGCPNFLPHGTRIYNRMSNMIRKEYRARGFSEVESSIMNNDQLWMTSGHFFKYKDDMYLLNQDGQTVGIKPMNCPVHCSLFDLHLHSYRDLPIRLADFGALHRNEISGALSGLTRVRQFHQDDAHIFCTEDQMLDEIEACLDFVEHVYSIFGFKYNLELSTRPPLRVGSDDLWDKAEDTLRQALVKANKEFKIGEGEGAFYGPKIDIKVSDCYGRVHQLGTIQLDFNLPERFNLQYRGQENAGEDKQNQMSDKELEEKIAKIKKEDNKIEVQKQYKTRISHGENVTLEQIEEEFQIPQYNVSGKLKPGFKRPIMIHRAIFGSLERCIAILCEHYGGKWPFWMSPRQAIVIPISEKFLDYADKVYNRLWVEGYHVEIDRSSNGINKKVRTAQLDQHNYILVVGEKEAASGTITVRERDQEKPKGVFTVEKVLEMFKEQEPQESNAWKQLKNVSFTREAVQEISENKEEANDEIVKLEQVLLSQVYLSGDGLEFGDKDKEQYESLKDKPVDSKLFPSIARWMKFIAKKHSS